MTKSRTVKHNEEKNVKLLPRVHIGVPLTATLVLCLDRSNKNEKTSEKKRVLHTDKQINGDFRDH